MLVHAYSECGVVNSYGGALTVLPGDRPVWLPPALRIIAEV